MTLSDIASPFGVGLWTIETSVCMATIGLIAGLVWGKSLTFNRWQLAFGGLLLTIIYDVASAMMDALLYGYPWITSVLTLYIPFVAGGPSPYPFGLAHEITTSMLLLSGGPALIRQIRKTYR